MSKKVLRPGIAAVITLLTLLAIWPSSGYAEEPTANSADQFSSASISQSNLMANPPCSARIRVYIVEPNSRYINLTDELPYHYGCIDIKQYAFSLPYLGVKDTTFTWSGGTRYADIQQNNIMAIAAVFSEDPDNKYVYATAAAKVDTQWNDTAYGSYTHTVLVEEGTATWCPNCPNQRDALGYFYNLHQWPFFFVALIDDSIAIARQRVRDDLHITGFPTSYFDGGIQNLVGGYPKDPPYDVEYTSRLAFCASRDVHDFDLSVDLDWLGGGQIQIRVIATNKDVVNQKPNTPANPTGPFAGVINKACNFTTSGTDPDDNRLRFRIFWDSGDTSTWSTNLYNPGDTCMIPHTWTTAGLYNIKAQAKDEFDSLSTWSGTLQIVIHAFLAGDVNNNGLLNIQDVTYLINALYKGGAPPPITDAADANANCSVNIQDVTYLINHLYKGGLPPNYPDCP